jgi:hypothetical protein
MSRFVNREAGAGSGARQPAASASAAATTRQVRVIIGWE